RVDASVDGGEGWRRSNAFGVTWPNPPERYAPIVGAYSRLCSPGGSCRETRTGGLGLSHLTGVRVPGPGAWRLAVWRQDAAGNADRARASVPITLRYDPDPPRLAFERPTLSDPTRVSVLVIDRASGLSRGEIELRRQGTSSWQSLTTRREGSRLVAQIDDSRLAPGVYQLRSR